jgi:hypothetical protein
MTQIITFASPFIVSWLSGIIKTHALSDDASKALIRTIVAILSIGAALLSAWLNGGVPDNFSDLLSVLGLAVFDFLGATGIFHLTSGAEVPKK